MATTREQFIELLKQDIEQFETAAKRIEELLPHLGAELLEVDGQSPALYGYGIANAPAKGRTPPLSSTT